MIFMIGFDTRRQCAALARVMSRWQAIALVRKTARAKLGPTASNRRR